MRNTGIKELLENIGNFNGWRGNICLYFTKKRSKSIKMLWNN
jgi:hypothetical protein